MVTPELIPHDAEAERAVLGAVMLSVDALPDVLDLVSARDFYDPKNELIFDRALSMFRQGHPVDPITLAHALGADLERVGGTAYLHELIHDLPHVASASFYARIVADQATLRRLRTAATRILHSVSDRSEVAADLLVEAAQAEIYAVTESRDHGSALGLSQLLERTLALVDSAAKHRGEVQGVATGFRDLDQVTGGLRPGQLVVVAARPAIGKSTLALDIARHASVTQNIPTCLFTLEMDAVGVTKRLLAAHASIRLHDLDRGALSSDQWQTVANSLTAMTPAPLSVDDSPGNTLATIRAKCRRMKQQQGLGLVIIDYLQLLTTDRRSDSRQLEVAETSRGLKLLAKELGVPIVALSQLNRSVEQRTNRRPLLSDMRESGAIEQDADLVIMLHREDAYDAEMRPGEADLILAKHRDGPTGTFTVAFQSTYARFQNFPAHL